MFILVNVSICIVIPFMLLKPEHKIKDCIQEKKIEDQPSKEKWHLHVAGVILK